MATETIDSILAKRGKAYLVLDGGFATTLELCHGADLKTTNLWSAKFIQTQPQLVEQVHYEFAVAGADIVSTASYQASYDHFKDEFGFSPEQTDAVLEKSVDLVWAAADRFARDFPTKPRPLIAASMGPYGASLPNGAEFHGDYIATVDKEALKTFHRRRLRVLASHSRRPDLLIFETFPSYQEAIAVGELLDEPNIAPLISQPVWVSFSCQSESQTCHGESITEAVSAFNKFPKIQIVGVNCTNPIYVESLIQKIRTATEKAVVVYPNSGEVWNAEKREFQIGTGQTHDDYQELAKKWLKAGATIIGGCCRTLPTQIKGIAAALAQPQ